MKRYKILEVEIENKYRLNIPDIGKSAKIRRGSPQYVFIDNHWVDIVSEISALNAVLLDIFPKGKVYGKAASDLMAGCGFSATILKKFGFKLHLNDIDKVSFDVLKMNFPESSVTNKDANEMGVPKTSLVFVDFNNFTLKRMNDWSKLFSRISSNKRVRHLLVTDSACYGFKFGNLKRYGFGSEQEYYNALSERFLEYGFDLIRVSSFGNAAILLFERSQKKEGWKYLTFDNIRVLKSKGGDLFKHERSFQNVSRDR